MVEALVAHPLRDGTRIGGEAGDSDPDVVVDLEQFFLVGGEFGDGAFEGAEDGVGGGAESDAGGALFDGFHGVLYLEETAFGGPDCYVRVVLVAEHGFGFGVRLVSRFGLFWCVLVCLVVFGCV